MILYQYWNSGRTPPANLPLGPPAQKQVTFVGDAEYPAISPDGKLLAYVSNSVNESRLMLQDLKSGQSEELFKVSGLDDRGLRRFLSRPNWSPDGNELMIRGSIGDPPRSGIFLIPRVGGGPRLISKEVWACWSPDRGQIVTATGKGAIEAGRTKKVSDVRLRLTDKVTGSAKEVIMNGFEQRPIPVEWAPGRDILLEKDSYGKSKLIFLDPETGEEKLLLQDDSVQNISSARSSPDGKKVVFAGTVRSQMGLWIFSLADHSIKLHSSKLPAGTAFLDRLVWSSDGWIYAQASALANSNRRTSAMPKG